MSIHLDVDIPLPPPPGSESEEARDAELAAIEEVERQRLGLPPRERSQWVERIYNRFTPEERPRTTVLMAGLTQTHDELIVACLRGFGYRALRLDVPDNESLWLGKEFGNRGMCNPAYYTVGNLIKFLRGLEAQGMSRQEIVERYVLISSNGCGPCRFSMYLTEFRKALRDSGWEGFRVLLINQMLGSQEAGEGSGLEISQRLFVTGIKVVMLGDILNLLMYRIRPYELEPGATDAAIARCRGHIVEALEGRRWLWPALWRARRELRSVAVDRTRVKPRVSIIGEFWAMITEGEGNYHLQRFLEQEEVEVDIQLLTAWIQLILWEYRYDTRQRMALPGVDSTCKGLADARPRKGMLIVRLTESLALLHFRWYAWLMGLKGFRLPDMDRMAAGAEEFFDLNQRGGEMHKEVADLVHHAEHHSVHLTISVKPFGCLPSSGVSDGVQVAVTERFPQALFLPVETTGDGAVNVYSRIQMQLFKARQLARQDFTQALQRHGLSEAELRRYLARHPRLSSALHFSAMKTACPAANLAHEVGRLPRFRLRRLLRAALGRIHAA